MRALPPPRARGVAGSRRRPLFVGQPRKQKLSAKGYANNEYELEGFFKRTLCGVEAEGFSFTYKVQGVLQRAQNIVLKHGKTCYTIYWIERKGSGKSSERSLEFVLNSLAFAEA